MHSTTKVTDPRKQLIHGTIVQWDTLPHFCCPNKVSGFEATKFPDLLAFMEAKNLIMFGCVEKSRVCMFFTENTAESLENHYGRHHSCFLK